MSQEVFTERTFADVLENEEILRAVKDLEFTNMTPIQEQAMPVILEGRDVIGQAQTGTGKTAAFGMPILNKVDPANKNVQAIILCPTRELAVQAANELRSFAKYMHDVKVLPVYGGQDIRKQILGLKGVQIVVGTPGRVMDHMNRHTIRMEDVSMVVLDEADEMLNMGFLEDMEVILGAIEQEHQTLLFSATMPQEILELAENFQRDPELIKVTTEEETIPSIKQYYYSVKREYKTQALCRLLTYYQYEKCIIFCNTKAMVSELADRLQKEGYAAEGLHGDLAQNQRDSAMGRFRGGSLHILVATDIAARGIDVDNVNAVFNYDLPLETTYYIHRIGRTGRAGKEGVSHTLCKSNDFRKLHEIERVTHTTMEERDIPTAAEIRNAREFEVLNRVRKELAGELDYDLIDLVENFCLDNAITPEELAAAFVKMEVGEKLEELDISLPGRKKNARDYERGDRRGRRERRESTDREEHRGRKERRESTDREEHRGRKERRQSSDREEHRGHKDRREDRKAGEFKNRRERREEQFGKRKTASERKKDRNRSDQELKKALKMIGKKK